MGRLTIGAFRRSIRKNVVAALTVLTDEAKAQGVVFGFEYLDIVPLPMQHQTEKAGFHVCYILSFGKTEADAQSIRGCFETMIPTKYLGSKEEGDIAVREVTTHHFSLVAQGVRSGKKEMRAEMGVPLSKAGPAPKNRCFPEEE